MSMLSCARRTIGALAAAAVLSAALPAAAAVIVIPPEKMIPVNWHLSQQRVATWVASGGATAVLYWAPLRLPLGATIKGLVYYQWSNGTDKTSVMVTRAKVGAALSAADVIYYSESAANVPTSSPPTTLTTVTKNNPSSDTIVRPGYRYFIFVNSSSAAARVAGVKVVYQP